MGYTGGRLMELNIVNPGSQQIWLDDVDCTGSENRIWNCPKSSWGSYSSNCTHANDIGVGCDN